MTPFLTPSDTWQISTQKSTYSCQADSICFDSHGTKVSHKLAYKGHFSSPGWRQRRGIILEVQQYLSPVTAMNRTPIHSSRLAPPLPEIIPKPQVFAFPRTPCCTGSLCSVWVWVHSSPDRLPLCPKCIKSIGKLYGKVKGEKKANQPAESSPKDLRQDFFWF